jgi:hypothetical protein
MTLQVIGAGWGRTGTMSVKSALERLGLRTHHMHEVFLHPEQSELFLAAARGDADWATIYGDYDATVDWPGAAFWRELSEAFPDAKVLLTTRDPLDWYESYVATIREPLVAGALGTWSDMVREVILEREFGGESGDREHLMAVFLRHSDEVVAAVSSERLLVYRVSEGWEPLCTFLDVPVPDEPFPRLNDRASFAERNRGSTE